MAGTGARYFFLFLVGLVAGVICTVMAMRALEARKDPFHESVMHVQQWHMGQLKANTEQNRCNATDTLPHLQALRTMADDIEPAMPDLRDDERFAKAASQLRAALDSADRLGRRAQHRAACRYESRLTATHVAGHGGACLIPCSLMPA